MNATFAASSGIEGLDGGGTLKHPVLAVPTRQSAQQISAKADHAIRGVVSLMEDILATVVDSHKGDAFDEGFPAYSQMLLACSAIMRQTITPTVMQRVVWQSLLEKEGEFRQKGIPVFGEAVTEHAIFTVWSMRKIGDLIEQIFQAPELKSQSLEDKEFCKRYTYHAIRAFGRGSAWTACILLSGIIVRCRQTWLNTSATGCARQSIRMLGLVKASTWVDRRRSRSMSKLTGTRKTKNCWMQQ
jgi:hypothetical protein